MLRNSSLILLFVAGLATMAMGQLRTPAPSPAAKYTQTVGLIDVTVEYSRPGVKGRTIFGDLVPYDKIWRTGANAATKITFSDDVTIEGQELEGGSYAILTKPSASSWAVHFYPYESGNFGTYVEKEPAVAVTVTPETLPLSVEDFTIGIGNLHNEGGDIQFIWANTYVPVKLGVNSDEKVMAQIDRMMAGPSTNDYYAMGQYMHDAGKDLNKALKFVQKATKGDSPRFWQVRREALILADLGRKAEALEAAKLSMQLAKEAGNDDYVRMNEKSIKEWSM